MGQHRRGETLRTFSSYRIMYPGIFSVHKGKHIFVDPLDGRAFGDLYPFGPVRVADDLDGHLFMFRSENYRGINIMCARLKGGEDPHGIFLKLFHFRFRVAGAVGHHRHWCFSIGIAHQYTDGAPVGGTYRVAEHQVGPLIGWQAELDHPGVARPCSNRLPSGPDGIRVALPVYVVPDDTYQVESGQQVRAGIQEVNTHIIARLPFDGVFYVAEQFPVKGGV